MLQRFSRIHYGLAKDRYHPLTFGASAPQRVDNRGLDSVPRNRRGALDPHTRQRNLIESLWLPVFSWIYEGFL